MPHSGRAGYRDTQHGAVTATDVQTSNDAGQGTNLGPEGERAATRRAIDAALGWGMNNDQAVSKEMKDKRYAAIAKLTGQDENVAGPAAAGAEADDAAAKDKAKQNQKTAADCVEGFFEYQWRKMAAKSKKTKDKAKDKAEKDAATAEAALAKANKGGEPEKIAAAEAKLRDANAARDKAQADWKGVKDFDPNNAEHIDQCVGRSKATAARTESGTNAPVGETQNDGPETPEESE